MSDKKIKTAGEKPPLNMIPLRALVGPSRVYQYGAKKYAPGNYIEASDDDAPSRYGGAALRHFARLQAPGGLMTWASIAARDAESGLPEIDHLICSLLMLREIAIEKGALPEDPAQASGVLEIVLAADVGDRPRFWCTRSSSAASLTLLRWRLDAGLSPAQAGMTTIAHAACPHATHAIVYNGEEK